jgi:hypothetical protein
MALYKNKDSQKLAVFAYDTSGGAPKTGDAGNITAEISKDGAASAATNDTNPTELDSTDHPGIYLFDLTQAESNADLICVSAVSSTGDVELEPVIVYTEPELRSLAADQSGVTIGTCTANSDMRGTDSAALAANYTETRAGYLDALNVSGTLAHSDAAATYKATGFSTHSAADVWSAATRGLTESVTAGTVSDKTGYSLSSAGILAIWNVLTSALTTVGSIGKLLVDRLDAAISSRSSHAAVDVTGGTTVADAVSHGDTDWATATGFAVPADKMDLIDAPNSTAITEIQNGLAKTGADSDTLETLSDQLDGITITAADVADAVWDEARAGHVTADTFGETMGTVETNIDNLDAKVSDVSAPTVEEIDTQLSTSHGSGAWTAAGTGSTSFTYTLTYASTGLPIADALVWVTTDSVGNNVVASGYTDLLGEITFYLDTGTFYFWRRKNGVNFVNPDTEVVT